MPRKRGSKLSLEHHTLDYPPRGSNEIGLSEEEMPEAAEALSAEPDSEDEDKHKRPSVGGDL